MTSNHRSAGSGVFEAPPERAQILRLEYEVARDTISWLCHEMGERGDYQRGAASHLTWMLSDLRRRVEALADTIRSGHASGELTIEEATTAFTECLRATTSQLRLRYPNFWHELVMTGDGEKRLIAYLDSLEDGS